jgi:acetolactate synthase-1/2/3 large subunit
MHIVQALDRVSSVRCVLGLFEGMVTGAADGYARMAGKPACTLLHLGPGLANGLANLHNASRAQVPVVNIVGEHATYHLRYDAPLTSDIEAIARPYSKWLRTSSNASEIGFDAAEAVVAARTAPGQIATLIVPADVAWSEGGIIGKLPAIAKPPLPADETIDRAAAMLRSGLPTALLLAGSALHGAGLQIAGRIASATRAKLLAPYPITRIERGRGRPAVARIPYVLERATELLNDFRQLILVGARPPVAYFAYPDRNSIPTPPDCRIHTLALPEEDCAAALEALETALALRGAEAMMEVATRPSVPKGEVTVSGLAAVVAALLPENAIVADESMTSGRGILAAAMGAPPHDWLTCTGGSIGIAMPLAVGAAVACPERRILCLTADGSGMYTVQALWTMAREGLNVTTVVFANRCYAVLKNEYANLCGRDPGPCARDMFEIDRPDLDWVSLAQGMGVPGSQAASLEAFAELLEQGFTKDGPTLIEVKL